VTQVLHGLGRARGVEQAFAVRVFTEADEDLAVILGQGYGSWEILAQQLI
jgi:hypothetical protein